MNIQSLTATSLMRTKYKYNASFMICTILETFALVVRKTNSKLLDNDGIIKPPTENPTVFF